MNRIGMIGIGSNPSMAKFSHNAGWSRVLLSIAERDFRMGDDPAIEIVKDPLAIHDFDILIINEGLNYKKGSWNFFGGMNDKQIAMIDALVAYQGRVVAYNEEIEWSSLLKRKELREHKFAYEVSDFPKVETKMTSNGDPRLIFGDSHTVSIYKPGYAIWRNDGMTLNGFLNRQETWLPILTDNYTWVDTTLILYLGNIDMRFHVHRFGGMKAVAELADRYKEFLSKLKGTVVVQGLLPIEDESRKIPGTGKYKGEGFYGTREDRQSYVTYFNQLMSEGQWTGDYSFRRWNLPVDGFEAPKFSCMEARQSVHLRPEYYLYKEELKDG